MRKANPTPVAGAGCKTKPTTFSIFFVFSYERRGEKQNKTTKTNKKNRGKRSLVMIAMSDFAEPPDFEGLLDGKNKKHVVCDVLCLKGGKL